MKKNERVILFFDLEITAEAKDNLSPKPLSIKCAFEILDKIPKENRIKYTSKEREALYISDIKQRNGIITVLINKSDTTIADPVLSNPKIKERRVVSKKPNEGQDYSSHILLVTNENDPSQALALIESCQGLGASTIKFALESIIKNAETIAPENFTRTHPKGDVDKNGNPRKYGIKHIFTFKAHPSEQFKHDINNGTIHSIELIRNRTHNESFDTEGYFQEERSTLCIKPINKTSLIGRAFLPLSKILNSRATDYDKARIKFKTPEGLERSISYDLHTPNNLEYVKKEIISDFSEELKSSYDTINPQIENKMQDLYEEHINDKSST